MKNVLLILSIIDSRALIPSYKEKGLAPLPFLFIFFTWQYIEIISFTVSELYYTMRMILS